MHSLSDKKRHLLCRLPLLIVLLVSVLSLTALIEAGTTSAFDTAVIHAVQSDKSVTMQAFMEGITTLGTFVGVVAILILAGIWLWHRRAYPALKELLAVALVSFVTEVVVKVLVHRARPVSWLGIHEPGYSFPSGHAIMSFVIAVELVLILHRLGRLRLWKAAVLLGLAAAVGISRIYLGVHWPTDVIGSWLMGSVIILAERWI